MTFLSEPDYHNHDPEYDEESYDGQCDDPDCVVCNDLFDYEDSPV